MSAIEALSQHLVPAVLVVARVSGLAVQGPVLSSPAIPMRLPASGPSTTSAAISITISRL